MQEQAGSRGFTIPSGFPKAGSFSMQFWCSQVIVFWWREVYTSCRLSNIKVLKRSMFVYHPHLGVLCEGSSLKHELN